MQQLETDFLVVGAGPIGSATALALAHIAADLNVLLLDQLPVSQHSLEQLDTKVFAINRGSRQLLTQLNVWDAIQAQRVCAYEKMHVWDAQGTGFIEFDANDLVNDFVEDTDLANELGHIVEVGVIQNALNDKIANTKNIQVIRPAKITAFNSHQDHISVQLDKDILISAKLLCAADGGQSLLRTLAGIASFQEDCQQQALVANIQIERSHENCAWQIFRPTGPLAFLPVGDGQQNSCSIVWSLDNQQAEKISNLTDADFERALQHAVEGRFGKLKLLSKRVLFPLYQRHADEYGIAGMLLVGDAAHSIHPLAGLGANLGFQDVAALHQEVKRAHERGIAFNHPAIVSRYQRSRRLENAIWLKIMRFFRKGFADHGLVLNALRNMGLRLFAKTNPLRRAVVKRAFMSD